MEPGDNPDDIHWKWGFIYYNLNDNKVLVPKRYGIGWTLNFANRWSYVSIAVLIIILYIIKHYAR
jgi:uncharacterized membrane protein